MNPDLQFVDTKAGRFEVGEKIRSRATNWTILGFGYKLDKLWFYVKYGAGNIRRTEGYPHLHHDRVQFFKIPQPKELPKYKEPSGLYFDRKIGFERVETDG